MIKKEINLYSINELPEKIREKVIEENRDINTDLDYWYDYIYEEYTRKLENFGFMTPEFYFSGFWCQGDGACFDCGYIDFLKFIENYPLSYPPEIKSILEHEYNEGLRFTILTSNNHYYHERTRYIDIQYEGSEKEENNSIIKKLIEDLEETRIELCQLLYKDLEEGYTNLTSDKAVIEDMEYNNLLFFEDGTLYNE